MYIKLDESMSLVITVNDSIYRGDNLNRKIIYLIPLTVGEIDMLTANVYLSYIRADGVPDVVILERMEDKYKELYYQYTIPVTCKLTKYPGEICTWLQIYSGTPSNPTISKSGECMLYVQESKNMDDYLCDHQMTALYQLQKAMESEVAELDEDIAKMNEDIAKKADDIMYDDDGNYIQLKANGTPIGSQIDMESVSADVTDEVIDFGGESDSDTGSGEDSDDSSTEDNGSSDDVIYF